jgi:hypothetical protein
MSTVDYRAICPICKQDVTEYLMAQGNALGKGKLALGILCPTLGCTGSFAVQTYPRGYPEKYIDTERKGDESADEVKG